LVAVGVVDRSPLVVDCGLSLADARRCRHHDVHPEIAAVALQVVQPMRDMWPDRSLVGKQEDLVRAPS